jgi:gamma-glutamyltranspeptidase
LTYRGITDDKGTSTITATDSSGLVVSIMSTVGCNWGSHIIVPEYGFVLDDCLEDSKIKEKGSEEEKRESEKERANFGESAMTLELYPHGASPA